MPGDFYNKTIRKADIEESKSNAAMNAWLLQAIYITNPTFIAISMLVLYDTYHQQHLNL